MKPRLLKREELETLLPDGDWIHVFTHPGNKKGMMQSREWVYEMFDKHGMEVGGPEMKKANHAIVFIDQETQLLYAIQNRLERKANG